MDAAHDHLVAMLSRLKLTAIRDQLDSLVDEAGRRELTRKVQADCAIEVDGNAYSVPWRLIGERVRVTVTADVLRVVHAGREVAVHAREGGRRRRVVDTAHFEGVAGSRSRIIRLPTSEPEPALLRPLAEYEALIGGGF